MPAKIDRCVSKVKAQGHTESEAYAICSKSTGIVKTGKHTWGKQEESSYLTEDAVKKVEGVLNQTAALPLDIINQPIDYLEKHIDKKATLQSLKDRILADPTKQTRTTNAKEWAGLMGGGSLLMHAPMLLSGDPTQIATAGGVALGNAAKGSLIGPMLTGGKDTLLKSVMIPAGVTAALTKPINDVAFKTLNIDDVDFDSTARAGLIGAVGAGMWALRHRHDKKRQYV